MHALDTIQHGLDCVGSKRTEEVRLSASKTIPEGIKSLSHFWVLIGLHTGSAYLDDLLYGAALDDNSTVIEHALSNEATEDFNLVFLE